MNKKAQHSRNDMAIQYAICVLLVFITVGVLCQIGILGDIKESLNGGGLITAAAVVEDTQEEGTAVSQTGNVSVEEDG